jgi:dTDP-3,4-didehydro-2,6-dideoxy-alpha-D-glucose 3-reductase
VRVLLIGLSSIAQRRVLPALAAIPEVSAIDIASRSKPAPQPWPKPGNLYSDYSAALDRSDADLVYVSLPNSDHLDWIRAALRARKHVVVDKPATLTAEDAERCVEEAAAASRLLAEATVFAFHTQIAAMRAFVSEHGPLTHIDAHFIIPPMPLDNFRNHRASGGGCLHDMGPYAAAVGRLFGGDLLGMCAFAAPAAADRDIDMGFSFAAAFGNGARYTGHFSFESEYQNRLMLVAKGGSLTSERVFSPPADLAPVWSIRRGSQSAEREQPACDSFHAFLTAVTEAIGAGRNDAFYDDLVADARFREHLAAAMGHGETCQ